MEGRASYVNDMDNLKATELRLGLPGSDDPAPEKTTPSTAKICNKRALPEDNQESKASNDAAPVAKAQVVGWPPVRSFRRNSFQARKTGATAQEEAAAGAGGVLYVKVSMDGAPYLRKIDLKVYKGYKELREGLEDMFKCFSLGDLSGKEECNRSEYAIAYEDKDGDLMLAGDVPWEMFISSCKRLRIMRGSEARGLGSFQ